MLVETDKLVPADRFRNEFDKYVAAAEEGCRPIAVTKSSEIAGTHATLASRMRKKVPWEPRVRSLPGVEHSNLRQNRETNNSVA